MAVENSETDVARQVNLAATRITMIAFMAFSVAFTVLAGQTQAATTVSAYSVLGLAAFWFLDVAFDFAKYNETVRSGARRLVEVVRG